MAEGELKHEERSDGEGHVCHTEGDENSCGDSKKPIEGFAEETGVIRFVFEEEDLGIRCIE